MKKTVRKNARSLKAKKALPLESQFAEISTMILAARQKAFRAVDAILVELYWNIGEYISKRVAGAEWGEGTVEKLSEYLENAIPDSRGFNRRGLYRMRQFYEAYGGNAKVSPLVTQIQWSNHLLILSGTKSIEDTIGKYTTQVEVDNFADVRDSIPDTPISFASDKRLFSPRRIKTEVV